MRSAIIDLEEKRQISKVWSIKSCERKVVLYSAAASWIALPPVAEAAARTQAVAGYHILGKVRAKFSGSTNHAHSIVNSQHGTLIKLAMLIILAMCKSFGFIHFGFIQSRSTLSFCQHPSANGQRLSVF